MKKQKLDWPILLFSLLLLIGLVAGCGPNGEIGGRNSSDSADSATTGDTAGGNVINIDSGGGPVIINTGGGVTSELFIAISAAPGGSAGIITFTGAQTATCTATCDGGAVTVTVNNSGESVDICASNSAAHDMTCTATASNVTVTDTITLAH